QHLIDHIDLNISLKSEDEVEEACKSFTTLIQVSVWKSTPEVSSKFPFNTVNIPDAIQKKVAEKRRLRAKWHDSRLTADKQAFNKATMAIEVAALSRQRAMEEAIAKGDSNIQKFYCNSTVFLTGGSGFLGKQIIEKLL
ncbi:putative rna-directed dna polymerase from mobile element jockey-like protein, partial [Operophtera brumata]